jgi:hypothetical protein
MISFRVKSLLQLLWVVSALIMPSPAVGAEEHKALTPELRQLITEAGMVPWRWRPAPLDETLYRGLNWEKVQLRQFMTADKPLLVYMYGYW